MVHLKGKYNEKRCWGKLASKTKECLLVRYHPLKCLNRNVLFTLPIEQPGAYHHVLTVHECPWERWISTPDTSKASSLSLWSQICVSEWIPCLKSTLFTLGYHRRAPSGKGDMNVLMMNTTEIDLRQPTQRWPQCPPSPSLPLITASKLDN